MSVDEVLKRIENIQIDGRLEDEFKTLSGLLKKFKWLSEHLASSKYSEIRNIFAHFRPTFDSIPPVRYRSLPASAFYRVLKDCNLREEIKQLVILVLEFIIVDVTSGEGKYMRTILTDFSQIRDCILVLKKDCFFVGDDWQIIMTDFIKILIRSIAELEEKDPIGTIHVSQAVISMLGSLGDDIECATTILSELYQHIAAFSEQISEKSENDLDPILSCCNDTFLQLIGDVITLKFVKSAGPDGRNILQKIKETLSIVLSQNEDNLLPLKRLAIKDILTNIRSFESFPDKQYSMFFKS